MDVALDGKANMPMPDAAQGKAAMPQHGSSWKDSLPAIARGFQGAGLIGAGLGLAGALTKKKKPAGMMGG